MKYLLLLALTLTLACGYSDARPVLTPPSDLLVVVNNDYHADASIYVTLQQKGTTKLAGKVTAYGGELTDLVLLRTMTTAQVRADFIAEDVDWFSDPLLVEPGDCLLVLLAPRHAYSYVSHC